MGILCCENGKKISQLQHLANLCGVNVLNDVKQTDITQLECIFYKQLWINKVHQFAQNCKDGCNKKYGLINDKCVAHTVK